MSLGLEAFIVFALFLALLIGGMAIRWRSACRRWCIWRCMAAFPRSRASASPAGAA